MNTTNAATWVPSGSTYQVEVQGVPDEAGEDYGCGEWTVVAG
ncbi:hypothetical protein [Streptomyces sp. MMG1533]|nr:hypothetical protein [Streptomyces sp. MMG1533]